MLARLLLLPLLLFPATDTEPLARTGISDRELTKLCKDVAAFFEALEKDDRGAQQESLDKLESALEKAAKKGKVKDSMLAYLGDWDVILENAKAEDRAIKGLAGKGFSRVVFADPWDSLGRRVVSMLSLPGEYTKASELLPAIIGLKGSLGVTGADLEAAVAEQASSIYGDLMDTHIILIPVGLEEGDGRKAAASETDGSWYSEDNKFVFFTGFRVLLEQLRFDRSRLVLDGLGPDAGLDALRLGSSSPSFFAGVIDRSGGIEDELAILENLEGVSVLYVRGAKDGGPEDVSPLEAAVGDVVVVTEPGSALAPSDEARTAIAEWIRTRVRDLAPQELEFKVRDLLAASVSWCTAVIINRRVTATPSDPDYPRIKASIDPGTNTITLDTVNVLEIRLYLSDALLDLDKPVTVKVNGEEMISDRTFRRSLREMLVGRFYNNSGDYGLYTTQVLIEDIKPNIPK